MAQQPDPADLVPIAYQPKDAEYRFVDSVDVQKPGENMVYISFSQLGTTDIDASPQRAVHGVTRVVMVPALVDRLIADLTAIRDRNS